MFAPSMATTKQTAAPADVRTKGELETYQQWGFRYAGKTEGKIATLMPALQNVVLTDRQEQEKDKNLQQQRMLQVQTQISALEADFSTTQGDKAKCEEDKKQKLGRINDINNEIGHLKTCKERRPMAQVYFYIGLFIILLLAVYLFIFYSSASYEAFFGDVGEFEFRTLFNPNALQLAYDSSMGELLFIVLMPVIFLALGFLVHRNLTKDHWVKYLKVTALYFITFVFDVLLAFLITKNAYVWEAAESLGENPPYTVSLAFARPDFWVVIFAGFVAYVIWGLVFDSTMESYEDITTNNRQIRLLQNESKRIEAEIARLDSNIKDLSNKLTAIKNQIDGLKLSLQNKVLYDLTVTKNRLNQFIMGWQTYLSGAGKSNSAQQSVQDELDKLLATLK